MAAMSWAEALNHWSLLRMVELSPLVKPWVSVSTVLSKWSRKTLVNSLLVKSLQVRGGSMKRGGLWATRCSSSIGANTLASSLRMLLLLMWVLLVVDMVWLGHS